MKLYIAEKPSLGRAIAEVLPGPHRKGEGCIHVGNGDCVSWCVGHLLEQAEPAAYNAAFKAWRMEHLPIVPDPWQLTPRASSRKQLSVLRKLVKSATALVHAGDPDREGQLLVDEVIAHLKVSGGKRDSIQRCLISDLNPSAVRRALQQMRSNKEFAPLSTSALARSRADWLYGINMTRVFTLQGRKVGYQGLLSVGRVQTPVLGLVVRRDEEIESFVPKAFCEVIAHLTTSTGESFKAKWQPSEACEPWQDDLGRVLSKALAENVVARIAGVTATVVRSTSKQKKQAPPLPFSLSALQIAAAKRYSMTAKQVLDTCQSLYERHKLLTYPRSDCRYLPLGHFAEGNAVRAAVASTSPALSQAAEEADSQLRSKAFDDSKVGAHHAIIPTAKKVEPGKLSTAERNVYELVGRQYIAQFYPSCEYRDSQIDLEIAGGQFIARAREQTRAGWKKLFSPKSEKTDSGDGNHEAALNKSLPVLEKGDQCDCARGELVEKQTSPPKPFDDASLLAAMTGISRYVQDQTIRKVLKDTDGLGTEATRAGIIELLFTRQFLHRQGKQIRATEAGRALIHCLPEVATRPDMTAQWETQLDAISRREASYEGFMEPLQRDLLALIEQSQSVLPIGLKNLKGVGKTGSRRPPRKARAGGRKK
jgi:DNA topoisomerase-3